MPSAFYYTLYSCWWCWYWLLHCPIARFSGYLKGTLQCTNSSLNVTSSRQCFSKLISWTSYSHWKPISSSRPIMPCESLQRGFIPILMVWISHAAKPRPKLKISIRNGTVSKLLFAPKDLIAPFIHQNYQSPFGAILILIGLHHLLSLLSCERVFIVKTSLSMVSSLMPSIGESFFNPSSRKFLVEVIRE